MTTNESKLVKQTLKGLADSGLISAATMAEITGLKETPDGKPARPDLVTRQEAAKMLGVCPHSLINWQKSGTLQPIKLAGKRLIRYKMEDISSLLETVKA